MRVILFTLLTMAMPAVLLANEWELMTNQEGISVFKREDPNSNLLEFKGQGVIAASPQQLVSLLQDVSRMTEWVDGCSDSALVEKNYDYNSRNKRINDFRVVLYGRNNVPWPVSDRDYVLEGKIRYNKKNDYIYLDLLDISHSRVPPKSGIVRMNFMKVKIIMKPLKNDTQTWFQLYVHLDPGGLIPSWIVNFITKNVPLNSIRNLRKIVRRKDHDKQMEELINYHFIKLRGKK